MKKVAINVLGCVLLFAALWGLAWLIGWREGMSAAGSARYEAVCPRCGRSRVMVDQGVRWFWHCPGCDGVLIETPTP